jgi:hypothetical protein
LQINDAGAIFVAGAIICRIDLTVAPRRQAGCGCRANTG